ncbi:hypothetical protein V1477_017174 [Vespula maculifrons]|uniref:Uncharacterized protein n=1 Tax=Vespula maculifrons TaxID=7453 RepID=A0ABD2B5B3_VESMC
MSSNIVRREEYERESIEFEGSQMMQAKQRAGPPLTAKAIEVVGERDRVGEEGGVESSFVG